jgi:hypothetical protein
VLLFVIVQCTRGALLWCPRKSTTLTKRRRRELAVLSVCVGRFANRVFCTADKAFFDTFRLSNEALKVLDAMTQKVCSLLCRTQDNHSLLTQEKEDELSTNVFSDDETSAEGLAAASKDAKSKSLEMAKAK